MRSLLGNDLVINENDCNLSCQYCLTGQSNLKQAHREQLIFQPPRRDRYGAATPLGKRLDAIIDRIVLACEAPLLKITGGEVFLIDNVIELVEAAARRLPSVVLQTNGVLVNADHLTRLAGYPNITLQVSLDSHLFEGNSFRVPRRDLHDKIVKKISTLLEANIPMEIYAVLNERSVEDLPEFVAWLDGFGTDLQLFAFPLRGPDSQRYELRADQIGKIETVIQQYDRYSRILPPMAYFNRLMRFFREGGRAFRCHLPRLVVSSFSDGTLTACPNIWFSEVGNLIDEDWQSTLSRIGQGGLYHALTGPRVRLDACRRCFTPWDLLSMYFDDEITLAQLCEGPMYRPAAIRDYMAQAKAKYDSERLAGAIS